MNSASKHSPERPAAADLRVRPPIVVVLGHVDHGKSTLLDFIRKSNTVAQEAGPPRVDFAPRVEAGGITQHVAAYEVEHEKDDKKKHITFIDTPGHAAFSAIRARGANIADIAVLVVAADDGVREQTLEALQSIRDAGIPFVVAINKIDKSTANLERTQAGLMEHGVYLEKLGGEVPWTAISAKAGTGVEELLDLILLVAEMHELSGDAKVPAHGYVIEAHRDQKRGIAATLIITEGTLKRGMAVVAGRALGPVRIMETTTGKAIREASFSTPVVLTGFDELPHAGEEFHAFRSKRDAEEARAKRSATPHSAPAQKTAPAKETAPAGQSPLGGAFSLPIIIRADTAGSLEAIEQETAKLGDEHARVSIVQSGIGNISENDVKAALGSAPPAAVIGFNVVVDDIASALARQHGVSLETFDIIYKLTERLGELLHASRPKRSLEEVVGRAKILKQFSSRKESHVVGGKVSEGYLARASSVRVARRNVVVGVGKIKNIQTNKQDVNRVDAGSEFGAQIAAPFEITQGDVIECFVTVTK